MAGNLVRFQIRLRCRRDGFAALAPYNEGSMRALRVASICCLLLASVGETFGQADFRVYRERPRLFLEPARLARLRKDVDRQTLRWQALRALIEEGQAFPEQPFVDALRFQIEGDEQAGGSAVAWSQRMAASGIRAAAELRLAALVYDWCRDLFDEPSRLAVQNALAAAVEDLLPRAGLDAGLIRAAVLASIALAGDWPGSEAALGELLQTHWKADVAPALARGDLTDDGAALVAVLEATLAVRHNLELDLLRETGGALSALASTRLLSYFPLDIDTEEGRARRPSGFGADEREARLQAPLYRIADMLLVAYESNLREFQFIQGWIRDDNYLLRSPMAAPYEFLWVNPYLPGLTPQSAPLLEHDPVRGRLYGRQSWQRPTTWVGYANSRLTVLADETLSSATGLSDLPPMFFPEAAVVPVEPPAKLALLWEPSPRTAPETAKIFLVGLRSGETYSLKINQRETRLVQAGAGGILVLRTDPTQDKRDRIDLRKRVRLQLRPTLKPTAPGRPRPTLGR